MKILSWNVKGLRSALRTGLAHIFQSQEYDVVLLQETKADALPLEVSTAGYGCFLNAAKRKGYSGTLTLSRTPPLSVSYGMGVEPFDSEGRVITTEYPNFFVVNAYFPNSKHGLTRLGEKLEFNAAPENHVESLGENKPVVMGGDFNVAHTELDIARPKDNVNNPGFTKQEREWMTHFLSKGYVDTFRLFEKGGGHYTWWSYRFNARQRNIGWRIDYIVVSEELKGALTQAGILDTIPGSDHAPVYATLRTATESPPYL